MFHATFLGGWLVRSVLAGWTGLTTLARLFRLLASHRYAFSVYGLAMSSSKLEELTSAIVITSDDT